MIDQDRDGIIGADDLAAIYNQIGEIWHHFIRQHPDRGVALRTFLQSGQQCGGRSLQAGSKQYFLVGQTVTISGIRIKNTDVNRKHKMS